MVIENVSDEPANEKRMSELHRDMTWETALTINN